MTPSMNTADGAGVGVPGADRLLIGGSCSHDVSLLLFDQVAEVEGCLSVPMGSRE